MKSIRRELRVHRTISGVSLLSMVMLATTAFQQTSGRNLGEITVERINVVESDGRLRMVIANSERQTPGSINGKSPALNRKRPAGVIFFNDEGDEDGGLVFSGRDGNAAASLTFDQYKQDQTVGISYNESDGKRSAGLMVRDHVDIPLDQLMERFDAAQKLPTDEQRKTAMQAIGANDNGAVRVFVGKNQDRAAVISLADAHGKPRLTLTVDASGAPRIELLDEAGKVVGSLPDSKPR
jgi:hypothetical protein